MIYFYHHYELPTILRQAHQGDEQFRTPPRSTAAPSAADSNPSGGLSAANGTDDLRSSGPTPTTPERSPRPSGTPSTNARTEPAPEAAPHYNITTLSAELTFTSRDDVGSQSTQPEPPPLSPRVGETETSRTVGSGPNFLTAPNLGGYGLRLRNPPSTSSSSPTGEVSCFPCSAFCSQHHFRRLVIILIYMAQVV